MFKKLLNLAMIAVFCTAAFVSQVMAQDINNTTWGGWTDKGSSIATGVWARNAKTNDYQIYTVVFIYDSLNPVPGTSSGFVNGDRILGIGIRNNSGATGSPSIKLDPDNNSYAPSPDGIVIGQASFSGNGDLGDPIVNTSGGNPTEITIRSANPYVAANDYYLPNGGAWGGPGQPGFRGINPGAGVWKTFFDLDQMTAEFGPGGTRNIPLKPTLDAGAFGSTITVAIGGLGGTEAVINASMGITRYVDVTDSMAGPSGCGEATPAFTTIGAAITAAGTGDTISVCPGTYNENVSLNKSLTLNGAQAGVDARGRVAAESIITPATTGITLSVGSAGAVIDGFTISGGVRGIESTSGPIHNLQVLNNRVIGFSSSGVSLNDSGTDITINQNVIDGGSKIGAGGLMHLDTDSFNGFHFTNNNIVGKGVTDTSTGFFVDGNHNVGPSTRTPLISGNLINACNTGMNLGSRAFGSQFTPNAGTISSNTFSNNNFDGLQGGMQNTLITGNTFSNNARAGLALTSFGNTGADRGAQNSDIKGNLFTGNGSGPDPFPAADSRAGIFLSGTQGVGLMGTNRLNFNRIVGNFVGIKYGSSVAAGNNGTIDVENNWWGCNTGPGGAATGGCVASPNGTLVFAGNTGILDSGPWLVLTTSAATPSVIVGGTDAVTSLLTTNSDNVTPVGGFVPNGTPATFAGTFGSVLPAASTTTSGSTGTVFTGTAQGVGGVATTVDGQTVNAQIVVYNAACSAVSTASTTSQTTYPSPTGVGVTIPVTTDLMTGRGAISADFIFTYNDTVMRPKPVAVLAGPVAGGGTVTYRTPTSPIPSPAGTVIVSVVNFAGFAGSGALVTMEFDVIGNIGTSSPLGISPISPFTSAQLFNGGYLQCNTVSTGTLNVVSGTVSGTVTYGNAPAGPAIPVKGVNLNAPGTPTVSATTHPTLGTYSMSGFGPLAYTITASKAAYPGGSLYSQTSIGAGDATAIIRHVVGLEPLTDPDQLLAAKVSGLATPALSSFDAALISQWVVAIPSPINQTGQWKFTPASYGPTIFLANVTQDYSALLMGDVDQSWDNNGSLLRPALTEPTERSVLPSITSMEAEKGREVTVPFRIDNLGGKSVGSYQFDIEFDPTVIEPVPTAADVMGTQSEGLTIISNSPEPGLLKVAAYGALPASGDGVYVNLKFRTIGTVGSTTQVSIREFLFNNGSDEIFAKGGRVSVTKASDDMGIKGRVISALGQPVANARVTLTATDGTTRTTVASSLGSYEFSGLTAGETYTVTVSAKRFTFESRSVSMTGSTVDLDMIARQ